VIKVEAAAAAVAAAAASWRHGNQADDDGDDGGGGGGGMMVLAAEACRSRSPRFGGWADGGVWSLQVSERGWIFRGTV
jgi:hypothetical protein